MERPQQQHRQLSHLSDKELERLAVRLFTAIKNNPRLRKLFLDTVEKLFAERLYQTIGKWAFRRFLLIAGSASGGAWLALEIAGRLVKLGVLKS